jgi:hypothetical protein
LPYVSAVPAAVAVCVLLWPLLGLLPRWESLNSTWIRPFVEEPKEDCEGLDFKPKKGFERLTAALLGASVLGLGLQLATVFNPTLRYLMIYPAASWAIAGLLIIACRPKTAPKGLLMLYSSIFATQLIVVVERASKPSFKDIPAFLAILTAFTSVVIILFMPLRDPMRPIDEISPTFNPPTVALRSPEDNLTLWHFMSVSWMTPLISLGNQRQLNEDDVWSLGYEFKHRILHDLFRDLKGSVLSRLLHANGLDLLILTLLSVIELTASTLSSSLLEVQLLMI